MRGNGRQSARREADKRDEKRRKALRGSTIEVGKGCSPINTAKEMRQQRRCVLCFVLEGGAASTVRTQDEEKMTV